MNVPACVVGGTLKLPEIKWFGKRVGVQDKIKSADLTHEFWEPRRQDLTSAASPGLRAPQWES